MVWNNRLVRFFYDLSDRCNAVWIFICHFYHILIKGGADLLFQSSSFVFGQLFFQLLTFRCKIYYFFLK